jgi:hypothetical protein
MPLRKIEMPGKIAAKTRLQQNIILRKFCWEIYAHVERIGAKPSNFVSPVAVKLANANKAKVKLSPMLN